jgi:hypothetical protein
MKNGRANCGIWGSRGHLVLVDVEAAELLVLPSPGDGEGAGRKLPERSANHGCGDLSEAGLLRSGNPTSVEGRRFLCGFLVFHFLFTRIFSFVFFLAQGVRRRAVACGPGAVDQYA